MFSPIWRSRGALFLTLIWHISQRGEEGSISNQCSHRLSEVGVGISKCHSSSLYCSVWHLCYMELCNEETPLFKALNRPIQMCKSVKTEFQSPWSWCLTAPDLTNHIANSTQPPALVIICAEPGVLVWANPKLVKLRSFGSYSEFRHQLEAVQLSFPEHQLGGGPEYIEGRSEVWHPHGSQDGMNMAGIPARRVRGWCGEQQGLKLANIS